MSDTEPIIAALTDACRKISDDTFWINSVRDSLDGMGAEEAAWKPGPEERSVWEIDLHMTVWTDWATNFLRGRDISPTDWPPVGATDSDAWEAARADLTRSLADFEAAVSALKPDDLIRPLTPDATPTPGLTGFLSILVHNAYHAGQITKLCERWLSIGVNATG